MTKKIIILVMIIVLVPGLIGLNSNLLHQELVQVKNAVASVPDYTVVQYAFGENPYDPATDRMKGFYDHIAKTELVYNGGTLTINQKMEKSEYELGERIWVERELVNNGNKTLGISYTSYGIFETYFINQANNVVIPKYGSYTTLLEGNEGVTIKPGSYTLDNPTGNKSYVYPPRQTFSFKINIPGNYTVISGASLGVVDNVTEPVYGYVWSKPIQITVLPEKYEQGETGSMSKIPEFQFVIPVFLASITSLIFFYRIKFR